MKNNNNAFTLLELLIVMTILWLMMTMAYVPYSNFQKKVQLKIASKQIAQILNTSRNKAIHWTDSSSWNLSIWIFFDSSSWKNTKLKLYWYPFDYWTWSQIEILDKYIIDDIRLEKDIEVIKINWDSNKVLFLYSAVNWDWNFFSFDSVKQDLNVIDNRIDIKFSYKWSSAESLTKTVMYYTKTYISDY